MKKEAEKETKDLQKKSNYAFKLVKLMKRDRKDVISSRCMKRKDGNLAFTEQHRKTIGKGHMERVMNEENEQDQITDMDVIEGPIEKVTGEEVMTALRKMKSGKATGPMTVDSKMIIASGDTGIEVIVELCQRVLDGRGMSEEWTTSVVVPIFKGKGDVMS